MTIRFYAVRLNDLDYCSKCNKLCDYLDLKPYNLRWYCKKCYKEATEEYPVVITLNLFELNDYDHCSSCGKLFDYLDLLPHELKWYCEKCFKQITSKELPVIRQGRKEVENA